MWCNAHSTQHPLWLYTTKSASFVGLRKCVTEKTRSLRTSRLCSIICAATPVQLCASHPSQPLPYHWNIGGINNCCRSKKSRPPTLGVSTVSKLAPQGNLVILAVSFTVHPPYLLGPPAPERLVPTTLSWRVLKGSAWLGWRTGQREKVISVARY
jgi:hypothetical protein